jgi:hypothetical protein
LGEADYSDYNTEGALCKDFPRAGRNARVRHGTRVR